MSKVLAAAMASATGRCHAPRSTRAISVVARVSASSPMSTMRFVRVGITRSVMTSSDQIEKRKEEDPDHVDQMPVEPDHLDRRVVRRGEPAAPGQNDQPCHETDAHREVNRVETCHGEVEKEERLERTTVLPRIGPERTRHEPFGVVTPVFIGLEAEKNDAQEGRRGEEAK